MKMPQIIILVIVLCLFPFSFTKAVKPDEFVEYLSEKIHNDCRNYDMFINNDSILGLAIINDPGIKKMRPRPQTISFDPSMFNIKSLVNALSQHEPYIEYSNYPNQPIIESGFYGGTRTFTTDDGEKLEVSNSGLGILYCADKKLDVTGYQYFWGGEFVEIPRVENKYNLSLLGLSVIQNGGITVVGLTIFSVGFISISLISVTSIRKRLIIWVMNKSGN